MSRQPMERGATSRNITGTALGVVLLAAVIGGAVASRSPSTNEPSLGAALRRDREGPAAVPDQPVGNADGMLPDGTTVFDDRYPGVGKVDPDLLAAVRAAATDAARNGIAFTVNSGWRSPHYQDQLLREAVAQYGSEAEAAKWVATADTSPHVSGDAVDLGPATATTWLWQHGAEYGLCQVYVNEPWHYELRREATDRGCPPLYADPTDDPRMQR